MGGCFQCIPEVCITHVGDFTRLHRCSFIKEDSGSLRNLGEALASGQAYLRSGLRQWHSAQVLPVQVQLQVQAIPLTTTPQASENNGLEPGDSGWVSSPLPQPGKASVPTELCPREHQPQCLETWNRARPWPSPPRSGVTWPRVAGPLLTGSGSLRQVLVSWASRIR